MTDENALTQNFAEVARQADRFGNWDERLRLEIPFFFHLLQRNNSQHVCDAGCGAGRHTVALAQTGLQMTGVDPNTEYIEAARLRAKENEVAVSFHVGGFEEVANLPEKPFDAVLVLGNALSLVEEAPALDRAIASFATALRPDGMLIIQVPNYDYFADPDRRWKVLSSTGEPEPKIVIKHFSPWGEWHFAVEFLTLIYDRDGGWTQEIRRTRVLSLTHDRLSEILKKHGLVIHELFGHADGRPYSDDSPDCIVAAKKVIEKIDRLV